MQRDDPQVTGAVLAVCTEALAIMVIKTSGPNWTLRSEPGCASNLKQPATAAQRYAKGNDNQCPAAAEWPDATAPYPKSEPLCNGPQDERPAASQRCGNSLNQIAGWASVDRVAAPGKVGLLFDAEATVRNSAIGGEDFAQWHSGVDTVSLLSGHVKKGFSAAQLQASSPRLERPVTSGEARARQ